MDSQIEHAIKAGEINQATMELVRNWCAHVRVDKFGGVGLIEQQTGLPIGNHGLKCDHAIAGGLYTWDLRDAALDFYDRNCIDCSKRKIVGVPNLSKLVKERDEQCAVEKKKIEDAKTSEAKALAGRQLARLQLREILSPLSGVILDHINEFDERRDDRHRDQLCESARLAPEHFVAELVNYIFELTERELWFFEVGLTMLDHLKADPARIARITLFYLAKGWRGETAAKVLLSRLSFVEPKQIPSALPAIIELAYPHDDFFLTSHSQPRRPELLIGIWQSQAAAVRHGLDLLLSSRRYYDVELAARGLYELQQRDHGVSREFLRSMVAKFCRVRLLLDDFDPDQNEFRYLRDTLIEAFELWSSEVDALVQEFLVGADSTTQARAYKIYQIAFRVRQYDSPPVSADSQVHLICFRRLLWAATSEISDEILRCVGAAFRGTPDKMVNIVRTEFDGLLGALLLLDDCLRRHDEMPKLENESFLDLLERRNRRSTITGIMSSLVEWGSVAAKDSPVLITKIMDLLDKIPEDRDHLKGELLNSFEHLGETVEGLKQILPHIYYALVGPSVILRSYAATALGKADQTNVPPLVYEAFLALLTDPYVMVHKAAVHAFHYIHLPEGLRGRAALGLLNLIRYYSQKSDEDRFVVECVEQLAFQLRHLDKAESGVGQYLIEVLLNVDPLYLDNAIRLLSGPLGGTEGFVDLLLKVIPRIDSRDYDHDYKLRMLEELSDKVVLSRKTAFEDLGKKLALEKPWLAVPIIEVLTRVGAWAEARRIAEVGTDQAEPTLYNEAHRIWMKYLGIAVAFEETIVDGNAHDLGAFVKQWEANAKREQEFKADVQRRNSRSSFPPPR